MYFYFKIGYLKMNPTILNFIQKQAATRQELLKSIHSLLLESDKTVEPFVEKMMGKEMLIYKAKGHMKYGLSSVKNYMSLHVMPIYGIAPLHAKYKSLLHKATFQKGCINFNSADEMPAEVLKQLFMDCSSIDLQKLWEQQRGGRK